MMVSRKRTRKTVQFLALAAAFLLLGLVVGCGGNGSETASPAEDTRSVSSETDASTQEAAKEHSAPADKSETEYWTCDMHPEVKEKESGQCPVCNMNLKLAQSQEPSPGEQ